MTAHMHRVCLHALQGRKGLTTLPRAPRLKFFARSRFESHASREIDLGGELAQKALVHELVESSGG